MELALIRHGQTDWNLDERVQGRTDIPLNETGREQARTAAELIRADGAHWDLILSSPLQRARETAEIIAEATAVPFGGVVDGLIEQNFGEGEGMVVAEFYDRWPNRDFPGGEHDDELGARGVRTLDEIVGAHPSGTRVLAVSHGSLIRGTIARLMRTPYKQVPRLDNTSISLFAHDEDWRVVTIGGVSVAEAIPTTV